VVAVEVQGDGAAHQAARQRRRGRGPRGLSLLGEGASLGGGGGGGERLTGSVADAVGRDAELDHDAQEDERRPGGERQPREPARLLVQVRGVEGAAQRYLVADPAHHPQVLDEEIGGDAHQGRPADARVQDSQNWEQTKTMLTLTTP